MIIIYGTRLVGFVDGRDGQHASTLFAHVFFMPMAHIEGHWVLDAGNRGGHDMKAARRSIAAGYIRAWGPIWAIVGFLFGGWIGTPIGIAALALTVWTWTWRFTLGTAAKRRSDMNQLAFGTRCDPRYFTTQQRAALRAKLESEWAALSRGHTPADVAAHGATSTRQAVVAYGLLRLIDGEPQTETARRANADALRLLGAVREIPAVLPDDPYRAETFSAMIRTAAPAPTAHAPKPARRTGWDLSVLTPRDAPPVEVPDAGALAARLANDLCGFDFAPHPIESPVLGVRVEAAWARPKWRNHGVVLVHAPPGARLGELTRELRSSIEVRMPSVFGTLLRPLELCIVWCGQKLSEEQVADLAAGLTVGGNSCQIQSICAVDMATRTWTAVGWRRPGPGAEIVAGCLHAAFVRSERVG